MEDAVAIVGYSHRMPGGIVTDGDFWRLLTEREIVREPIVDRYERGFRPSAPTSSRSPASAWPCWPTASPTTST